MAQKFGNTWWGKCWLNSLTDIDFENRIPRGASYARGGKVKEMHVQDGSVVARVEGHSPRPYRVTVQIPPFDSFERKKLIDAVVARPALISKLLNRELAPEMLEIAARLGLNVFPRRWTDLQMKCSCPDWAVPCKHLAAVIYMLSREIDNNPFLVFEMRNVDLPDELRKRGFEIESKSAVSVAPFSSFFVKCPPRALTGEVPSFRIPDFSGLQNVADAMVGLLPDAPVFYPSDNFRQKYAAGLLRISRNVEKLFKNNSFRELFVGLAEDGSKLIRRDDCLSVELDERMEAAVRSASVDVAAAGRKNRISWETDELMAALCRLPADFLSDYQPSVVALRQALFFAFHLLRCGAVVPQIVQLSGGSYAMQWMPALLSQVVRDVLSELESIFPEDTVKARLAKQKTGIFLKNRAECVVSFFLNRLVPLLSGSAKENRFLGFFFKGVREDFDGVGEKEIPGSIRAWLDRYFMSSHRYRPVFMVKEGIDDDFLLDVGVEDKCRTDGDAEIIRLEDLLVQPALAKEHFELLKELSQLSLLVDGLDRYINAQARTPIRFDCGTFAPFLLKSVPAIRLLDIKVLLPKSLQQLLRPRPGLVISSKRQEGSGGFLRMDDLLSFDWQVSVGGEVMSEADFRRLLKHAFGLIRFKQSYIYVDETDMERLHKAFNGAVPLTPSSLLQAALTEEFEATPIRLTDGVKRLIRELTSTADTPLPDGLQALLRPYQRRGYSWMYRNLRIGFGSILADDMGLGKTLQAITLLLKLKEEGALAAAKALVVVPTGLLTNWQAEIERFAPQLSVSMYHGTGREQARPEADVLLTTYGVLRSDHAVLKKKKWQVMVIDEAQNIKNPDTAQSKAVRSIPAATHIALSGTPVENNLTEFWTIMDFVNKGYLGTIKNFKADYANPIQQSGDRHCVELFRRITAPFMMRRLKSDKSIISDLPDKIEQNNFASLTARQAALYKETLHAAMQEIEGIEAVDSASLFKRQGLILQMILALKQICNHPAQFLKNGDFDASLSGKTEMLLDLLDCIVESGEKVLVFTQFREMGDMLQRFIEERIGRRPLFYHGGCSVKERQEMVERFQGNRADQVFLLSLKAAGTGLNLTAASHVIHYDLWWNPAVEAQATDRVYRIGQHKNVMVYRFIAKGTFEERIDAMIQKKKDLADLTVSAGENWIGKLSNRELKEVFG